MKQIVYYILGLGLGLVGLLFWQNPSLRLKIVACDVGQGDAILLLKGQTQVLVDGGPSEEKILNCLGNYVPFWDHTLELIVMTNTDSDHMNGLIPVLERYTVLQFVTADGVGRGKNVTRLIEALSKNGVEVTAVEQGDMVRILGREEIELKVLWPPEVSEQDVAILRGQSGENGDQQILGVSAKRVETNGRSVVVEILEDKKSILLMGDVPAQAERQMRMEGLLSPVEYLKVGHHGSKTATSQDFLAVVKPKTAVISVGAANKYGHPTEEVLKRLNEIGATVKRTDREGTVVVEF